MRPRAVVICPGRGTYNAGELGYLARYHSARGAFVDTLDALRRSYGQIPLASLDRAAEFDPAVHTRGDNASALIYTSSVCDFNALRGDIDLVSVTGNSMGWYSALAVAGAATELGAFEVANTMGTLMQEHLIGGQSLYPFVDDDWRAIPGKKDALMALVDDINARPDHALAVSIHLGGLLVVAGSTDGLRAFEAEVPHLDGRYPMRLANHAAFHTALQAPVAEQGRRRLPERLFQNARLPLVDGRGAVWWPGTYTAGALRDYTLGAQVVTPYDFTSAIRVAARTFAPDLFIIAGPGTTLGSAVAQALIAIDWRGLSGNRAFQERQKDDPVILSMGRLEDRARCVEAGQ